MSVNSRSSAPEVLEYLAAKCEALLTKYGPETFSGIDGEVFLGLVPDTVDMVLPTLDKREKGLLLARIESQRQASGFRSTSDPTRAEDSPSHFFRPSEPKPLSSSSATRAVTPPPQYSQLPRANAYSDSPEDLDDLSPKSRLSITRQPSLPPAPMSAELPRILIELWRVSLDDPSHEDYLAESWLPDLREFEVNPQTLRLALRRNVRLRDNRIIPSRKWFGSIVVSLRYHRINSTLELFLAEAKEMDIVTHADTEFFARVHILSSQNLSLAHTTRQLPISSSGSIEFDDHIDLSFARSQDGTFPASTAPVSMEATQKNSRGRSISPARSGRGRSRSPISVSESGLGAGLFTGLMDRNPYDEGATMLAPADRDTTNLLSLYDLLTFANRRELFNLNPRYNRFEAYLLPTHEVSAFFGTEFALPSRSVIDALSRDREYIRSQTQVVELLLLSWGTPGWHGQTWLLRHALLSTILMRNVEMSKKLSQFVKNLSGQIEMTENGFGEVLFTLVGDESEARQFWLSSAKHRGVRSPYIPLPRATLAELLQWVVDAGH